MIARKMKQTQLKKVTIIQTRAEDVDTKKTGVNIFDVYDIRPHLWCILKLDKLHFINIKKCL